MENKVKNPDNAGKNPRVREMLEKMYNLLFEKYKDPLKAWDYLIEFIATDNAGALMFQLNHKFEWLAEDITLLDSLMKNYIPELLRSDYHDHLGDMYYQKIALLKKVEGKILTKKTSDTAKDKPEITTDNFATAKKILDPRAGTGRNLMEMAKKNPEAFLYGVENDLRALRIAMTNFAIHGISGFFLHADYRVHEIGLNNKDGLHNWRYANKWHSCMKKLKLKKVNVREKV